MCVECPDTVIVIDAENSFRAQRIKQICDARGKDYKKVFEKIVLKQPKNWVQQLRCLYSLPAPPDTPTGKIGLVIVDSLTKEFRGIEFQGRQSLYVKQPLIREFALKITNMVKDFNAGLIITTQIYEDVNTPTFLADWTKIKAVGGSSLLHQPDFVVFLRRVKGQNIRIARMMDSSWQPLRECPFVITERGIDDLPDDAKARNALLEKARKFEEKQKQEQLKKKKKKTKDKKGDKDKDKTEEKVDKLLEEETNEQVSPESAH
jgi:DNA repair protein RadA